MYENEDEYSRNEKVSNRFEGAYDDGQQRPHINDKD
jgi:hypothetical protein